MENFLRAFLMSLRNIYYICRPNKLISYRIHSYNLCKHLLMKDFSVSVRKLTDVALLQEACATTFLGTSNATLLNLYKSEHSPVRTQLFWISLKNIPLYISTHLIRHHVGSVPFQLTCRDDRKGGNPGLPGKTDLIKEQLSDLLNHFHNGGEYTGIQHQKLETILDELDWLKDNADRYTPVNLSLCINAQSLIDMAKLRLCSGCAAPETVIVFQRIKDEIRQIDPDLASMMVRKCVYRNGLCGEQRCCGFNHTPAFEAELQDYVSRFTEKQKGNQIPSNTANE